ncbi:S41 family peptidase [Seleniivibrio sp.]|uniref:S41 family peptidase n=1 Tax=Seleniivibrio sp. TaxID=2898801 RepID=UPI0025F91FB7|nr:S41 family peptidase [Seleniivibrio sp.]MCD8553241.1 S41 family peptidase [Seleniivibrio sp.]
MLRLKLAVIICASFMLFSCGGGDSDSSSDGSLHIDYYPTECSEAAQIEFVYKAMHDVYLWADEAPVLNYASYSSQYDLMDDLKVSADRFSAIYTKQYLEDYYAGANVGLGFNGITNSTDLYVRVVYPDSPADNAGIKRGDRIVSMNGYTGYQIVNDDTAYEAVYGDASEEGKRVDVVFEDSENVQHSETLYTASYYADSVLGYSVLTNTADGNKVGYIMYNSFNENISDTNEAFEAFRDAGVKELVVDLRYNGGGLVSVAQYIASVIGGNDLNGYILLQMIYNNMHQDANKTYNFTKTKYDLNIRKIVFLVTGNTASASELVINGLLPFQDVYVIGTTTYGKAVGTNYISYCDKYLSAITFKNQNALGAGDYNSGLVPDCIKDEDIANLGTFGDSSEKYLAAAMTYLETGSCVSERSATEEAKVNELEVQVPWNKKIIK